MRFQPRLGHYLAAAAENVVSILDAETQACCHSLQVYDLPWSSNNAKKIVLHKKKKKKTMDTKYIRNEFSVLHVA